MCSVTYLEHNQNVTNFSITFVTNQMSLLRDYGKIRALVSPAFFLIKLNAHCIYKYTILEKIEGESYAMRKKCARIDAKTTKTNCLKLTVGWHYILHW